MLIYAQVEFNSTDYSKLNAESICSFNIVD